MIKNEIVKCNDCGLPYSEGGRELPRRGDKNKAGE